MLQKVTKLGNIYLGWPLPCPCTHGQVIRSHARIFLSSISSSLPCKLKTNRNDGRYTYSVASVGIPAGHGSERANAAGFNLNLKAKKRCKILNCMDTA